MEREGEREIDLLLFEMDRKKLFLDLSSMAGISRKVGKGSENFMQKP